MNSWKARLLMVFAMLAMVLAVSIPAMASDEDEIDDNGDFIISEDSDDDGDDGDDNCIGLDGAGDGCIGVGSGSDDDDDDDDGIEEIEDCEVVGIDESGEEVLLSCEVDFDFDGESDDDDDDDGFDFDGDGFDFES